MNTPLLLQRLLDRNSTEAWVEFAATTVAVFLGLRLLTRVVLWRSTRATTRSAWAHKYDFVHVVLKLVTQISTPTMVTVALYFGMHSLSLPRRIVPWVDRVVFLMVALQVGRWMSILIDTFFERTLRKAVPAGEMGIPQETHATAVDVLSILAKAMLYTIVTLLILNNAGVNITALVTGLGIGGIAVALALQTVLGDLFASLTIILDKTFVIGDMVRVGDLQGRIEKLGLKATRIRSLQGEQVILPNASLLQQQIRNFGRMDERRGEFVLGLSYPTSMEKLRKIPEWIQTEAAKIEGVRLDFARFRDFGESSLNFEVVFYVTSKEYNAFADARELLGLAVLDRLRREGVDLAFPTRTLQIRDSSLTVANWPAKS